MVTLDLVFKIKINQLILNIIFQKIIKNQKQW